MPKIVTVALWVLLLSSSAWAAKVDIPAPNGPSNDDFGTRVKVLPNGNFVVTDPYFDSVLNEDIGAVYLYNRAGVLINTLTGSQADDYVGSGGITVLANGNYVVSSSGWDNGGVMDAGAVTWRSATGANPGGGNVAVSANNSLVGSSLDDGVGGFGVTALSNGHYVVSSPFWDNGAATNAGAVTWGNGNGGTDGLVSAANSLIGSSLDDEVGYYGVTALSNGHYVVNNPDWDNGAATDAGAVTWGNGNGGTVGMVSTGNSLYGTGTGFRVGSGGVTALNNGNYVVSSSNWGILGNQGAVTWRDGTGPFNDPVAIFNSLYGNQANDRVGSHGVTALSNGHYVVRSPDWDNGAATNAGAVTWGNGNGGTVGLVSAANSLIGSSPDDWVGDSLVIALSNGHYVVRSPDWDNGAATDAGAVTWGNGNGGTAGMVSTGNSLYGTVTGFSVGSGGVTALSNGNYVVSSPFWGSATLERGAVTWMDGTGPFNGPVNIVNSLYGSTAYDQVGSGVTALSNGHYVVRSPNWDNGAATDAGAVTWGNGNGGTAGMVSTGNSLYGGATDFRVGFSGVTALSNGHYVVSSPSWGGLPLLDRGAVTWMDGTGPFGGVVSASNSLYGSTADDQVGQVTALPNGDYVVRAPFWDNVSIVDAGAVVWGSGMGGTEGAIDPDADHVVAGGVQDGGTNMEFDYDTGGAGCAQLVIGRPNENIVTLLGNPACLFKDGFE